MDSVEHTPHHTSSYPSNLLPGDDSDFTANAPYWVPSAEAVSKTNVSAFQAKCDFQTGPEVSAESVHALLVPRKMTQKTHRKPIHGSVRAGVSFPGEVGGGARE